jgi:hypothetical protein
MHPIPASKNHLDSRNNIIESVDGIRRVSSSPVGSLIFVSKDVSVGFWGFCRCLGTWEPNSQKVTKRCGCIGGWNNSNTSLVNGPPAS